MPLTQENTAPRYSQLARRTQQVLLEQFSPAAVVINANFETIYFSGPTENYLQMPRGAPTHDLLAQVRDGLRSRLRGALRQAIACRTTVVDDARVRRKNGFQHVRFSVVPLQAIANENTLFMVVFEDTALPVDTDTIGSAESSLVRQLEEELRATRDDLKNSIEQLESSNEELKASNEEIVSINEELQSLSKDLTTVNQQLQMKLADLENSNADINSLLASSQIATICLDRDYRIKWFSPGMKEIVNIIAGDVGRPIIDFSTVGLGGGLIEDANDVLATLAPRQRELLSQDKRWYLRRVVPYRSNSNTIGGVVVTYTDISEAKQTAEEVAHAQSTMAALLEQRVRERTAQLRTLTAELALTEERERRVLARDLHDDLGQVLAIVKIKLSSLEESERRGALMEAVKEIETLIDQANRSVRSLTLQLSPPTLQTLGLIPALEWLAEEMERLYGLAVHVDEEDDLPALDEPARTTIFRAIRELLINVAKHAKTSIAQLNCGRTDDGRISISVTDQGPGFDYQQALTKPVGDAGFGLISVRERVEFIGGEMSVDSMQGYGTTVTIVFPTTRKP